MGRQQVNAEGEAQAPAADWAENDIMKKKTCHDCMILSAKIRIFSEFAEE